jgi:DNA repair exonuclease SbcCD ATPase subunit
VSEITQKLEDLLRLVEIQFQELKERMTRLERNQELLTTNQTLLQNSYHQLGSQIGMINERCEERTAAVKSLTAATCTATDEGTS